MAEKLIKVPVTKGKDFVMFNIGDEGEKILPNDVYEYALFLGLKALVNRGMTGDKTPDSPSEAMEIAKANVELIYAGKVKFVGMAKTRAKGDRETMTEAKRIAKALVLDSMKRDGIKRSEVEPKEITRCAEVLIEENPWILEEAKANLAKRAEAKIKLSTKVAVSPELVAKAAAKKKVAKGGKDTTLSAKQAGMPKVTPKVKPSAEHHVTH